VYRNSNERERISSDVEYPVVCGQRLCKHLPHPPTRRIQTKISCLGAGRLGALAGSHGAQHGSATLAGGRPGHRRHRYGYDQQYVRPTARELAQRTADFACGQTPHFRRYADARWRSETPAEDGDGDVPSVVDAQWERDVVAGQLARTEAKLEDALDRLATADHDVKESKAAAQAAQVATHGCQVALDRAHADHATAAEACRAEVAKATAERDRAAATVEQLRARAAELESARAQADKAASVAETAAQRYQKDLEAIAQRLAAAEDAATRSREAVALALQPDVALDTGAATAGVWAKLCPALPDATTAVQHDKQAARLMVRH